MKRVLSPLLLLCQPWYHCAQVSDNIQQSWGNHWQMQSFRNSSETAGSCCGLKKEELQSPPKPPHDTDELWSHGQQHEPTQLLIKEAPKHCPISHIFTVPDQESIKRALQLQTQHLPFRKPGQRGSCPTACRWGNEVYAPAAPSPGHTAARAPQVLEYCSNSGQWVPTKPDFRSAALLASAVWFLPV